MIEEFIQKEIQKLDPDLFLDKEIIDGQIVYLVKWWDRNSTPVPYTVVEWSLHGVPVAYGGTPLPLSTDILYEVERQREPITDRLREVKLNNYLKREERRKDIDDAVETIAREFEKSSKRLHISGPWSPGKDVTAYKSPRRRG